MIGAILAGGFGKRLKPLTDEIPKAMIQIKENYTILDRQIFDFRNLGIKEIVILSGYLGEKIEERYGKEMDGIKFTYLKEDRPLGTLYSMRNLINVRSDSDVLLRNGDTVTDMNFQRFVEFSSKSPYDMTMFVTRMKSPFGIVDLLGDQILSFREKPHLDHFINSGVYYIKKGALRYFSQEYYSKDIETTVFPRVASERKAGAYFEDTLWLGIDSEKDLEQIRKEYENRMDFPWGFRKRVFSSGDRKMDDYYVRADQNLAVDIDGSSVVRITSGRGRISSDTEKMYSENDVLSVSSRFRISPLENTRFTVMSF